MMKAKADASGIFIIMHHEGKAKRTDLQTRNELKRDSHRLLRVAVKELIVAQLSNSPRTGHVCGAKL